MMICSIDKNQNSSTNKSLSNATLLKDNFAIINGHISYFNSDGYLSGELFFAIQVYMCLKQMYLFLCLIYFIFGLFWFYKFIIFYSGLSIYQKLISVIIPLVVFECLINLQIYTEINNSGSVGKIFIVLSILSLLIKNTLIRIILYGISIGFINIT